MAKLLFLGRLEDVAGTSEMAVSGQSLDAVIGGLAPQLAEAIRSPKVRVAVNGMLVEASPDLALADGDEVAFLPPVSGG